MKGCVKVIISLMLNRTRTIKSLPLIAVLFTCVVILSSAAIFASEESTPSSEVTSWLAPDLDDVQAKAVAEDIYDKLSEGTRSDVTITDVYNILRYDILPGLKGSVSNSNYSLPRIAYDTRHGLFGSGTMETVSAWDLLYRLSPTNNLGTNQFPLVYSPAGSGLTYTQAELSGMTWARVGDILSALNLSNSYLNAISSQLSGFNWTSAGGVYLGAKTEMTQTSYLPAGGGYNDIYFIYDLSNSLLAGRAPNVARFFLPYKSWGQTAGNYMELVEIYDLIGGTPYKLTFDTSNVFFEPAPNGTYMYLFDYYDAYNGLYPTYFHVKYLPDTASYYSAGSSPISYLSFDTDAYQQLKQAFYQQKVGNALGSTASDVKRLADYLADPDKIAAEQASQGVIDATLDGFTGSGSAAAKGSDIGSMKNISGSVQSGLDTGGSAGDAASVFTNANFWSWFTQSTSDGINNPYPAPTVTQRRGSGDEIPDFISGDHEELENYRNRRDRW